MKSPSPPPMCDHALETRVAGHFFLSYTKRGHTWLRALVGKSLADQFRLPGEMLLDTPTVTRAARLPVTAFDHDGKELRRGRP